MLHVMLTRAFAVIAIICAIFALFCLLSGRAWLAPTIAAAIFGVLAVVLNDRSVL